MKSLRETLKRNKLAVFFYNKFIDYKANRYYKKIVRENKIKVLSIAETIEEIVKNNCSIVRFGDGELSLIQGKSIPFEEYDKKLSDRLGEVLKSQEENMLVGIPNIFNGLEIYTKKDQIFWKRNLMESYDIWCKYLNRDTYANAFITRPYMSLKDKNKSRGYFKSLLKLFVGREVVLIEGEFSRLGCGNDLFQQTAKVERVLCPAKHAFSKYSEILAVAKKQPKDKLILLSLGPTAKLLALDLHKLGYQVLDIGHIDLEYEWYLRGVKEKVTIDNKFVNEVEEGDKNLQDTFDEKYEREIIAKVL